jgi:hypothetical protein
VLWSWAKFNRHPGPYVLAASYRTCSQHLSLDLDNTRPVADVTRLTARAASSESPEQPHHLTTVLLWSLAVLREHTGPLASLLAAHLSQKAMLDSPQFVRHSLQVAASLLAAQADQSESPLNTLLPSESKARVVAAWRAHIAKRAAQKPNEYQADVAATLRRMGFNATLNTLTLDACVCADIAVQLPNSQVRCEPSLRWYSRMWCGVVIRVL